MHLTKQSSQNKKQNKLFHAVKIKAVSVVGLTYLVSACSSIAGDQLQVGSSEDVNRLIVYTENAIGEARFLKTASYWAKCDDKLDGVGYQYRSKIRKTGKVYLELYFRLKSSQGAYAINSAKDDQGTTYAVTDYSQDVKSDTVVYEYFSIPISQEQLKKSSTQSLNLELIGDNASCKMEVEQPVNYAFYKNFEALESNDNWQRTREY